MEKRLLLAAALSLAVLILWGVLVPQPRGSAPKRAPEAVAATPTVAAPAEAGPAAPAVPFEPVSADREETFVLQNAVLRLTLSNRGGVVTSAVLRKHRDDEGRPLELVRSLPPSAPRPLALDFPGRPELTVKAAQALYAAEKISDRAVRLRWADGALEITKEVRVANGYLFEVTASVAGPPYTLLVGSGLRNPTKEEQASRYSLPAMAVATAGGGIERARAEKIEKPVSWPVPAMGFAGIEDNYFLTVFLPGKATEARVFPIVTPGAEGKPERTIAVGLDGSGALSARAFFGPKDVAVLESLHLGLERTVDFGWVGILARPLLWLLKKTYAFVGNYGLAILIVTLLIRILLFPLMHKSYASMRKMQKLAPKMNAIKDRYKKAKTDPAQRQKMNQEVMALYQAEGVNPMGGCLPLLIQMPVLFAFYYVLERAVELRHAPFAFWIKDLSAMDHTYVLLILMIASMYAQQAMTPATVDPTQKKIFMAMPLVWGFFLKDMPSGLVLYWLFSNLLTVLQQVLMNKLAKDDIPRPEPARGDRRKAKLPQAKGAGR